MGATYGFTNLDTTNGQPLPTPTVNALTNFGWEYVWHCHILSHEEADMMRPIVFQAARTLAVAPVAGLTRIGGTVTLVWTDATPVVDPNNPANLGDPQNEIGFRIQRRNGTTGNWTTLATALANSTTYADTTAGTSTRYYRVVAFNAAGDSPSAAVQSLNGGCTPTLSSSSASFTAAGGTGLRERNRECRLRMAGGQQRLGLGLDHLGRQRHWQRDGAVLRRGQYRHTHEPER